MSASFTTSSHQIAQLCYIRDDSTIAAYVSGQTGRVKASDVARIRSRYGKQPSPKPWFRLQEDQEFYLRILATRPLDHREEAAFRRVMKQIAEHPDKPKAAATATAKPKHSFTREHYERAVEMAARGMTMTRIGEILGFGRNTIREHLDGKRGSWANG